MIQSAAPVAEAPFLRETARAYAPSESAPAAPDGFQDPDALDELEEEICILAAHLHAADHRLLTLVAEFDRLGGWKLAGHRSCAHWLAFRTGIDLGACRERVRAARALVDLPGISDSMSQGELSFAAVRALTRVATPENETDLLDLAKGATAAQLERMVRGFKLGSRQSEVDRERERHESRTLSVFPDPEGMYVVQGRLTPEQGALLMRAVEAASDALFREKGIPADVSAETSSEDAARRRADALALVAERSLAAGFGDDAPISGTKAERYQVVLHVDEETLKSGGDGLGPSELEDGTRVSAETSRRLSCDASVVPIEHAANGSILSVGRKTRTIPPALRRALDSRDGGCRFPGCGLRFTDAHHVQHWADGGETRLDNLLLLCAHHHRLVHEEDWRIEWWAEGNPAFVDPRGQVHLSHRAAPPRLPADPVSTLLEGNRAQGIEPDYLTAGGRWKRDADIPDDVYFRAREAIG